MVISSYHDIEIQPWCYSWWHKFFYGSHEKVQKFSHGKTVEEFCNKCGGKTGGYSHFHIGELTVIKK